MALVKAPILLVPFLDQTVSFQPSIYEREARFQLPHPVTEHVLRTKRHTSAYLACGASDAPLIIFLHGWPELAISWRHQLPVFAELGFLCVAPDLRGYGRSSIYDQQADYALEYGVRDMLELVDSLGRKKAVWVGHDLGSLVVWTVASHHPERCYG